MGEAASRIILLVDSSKFGRKSPNVVCDLSAVDTLITDKNINPDYLAALQAKGINIILVGDFDE
ncbi:Glucitol operon repressor [compost metagenome]